MYVFLAWLAYLSISIMLGTLSATLYAAGKEGDNVTKWIAGSYGAIAFATLIYGYVVFQKRLTLISKRSGEHFGKCCLNIPTDGPFVATDVRSACLPIRRDRVPHLDFGCGLHCYRDQFYHSCARVQVSAMSHVYKLDNLSRTDQILSVGLLNSAGRRASTTAMSKRALSFVSSLLG